jgi:hypothetical protein
MLPFSASGAIEAINPGNVKPAGKSDRFIVEERQVSGRLSGDLSGPFTLTYAANVPIATQSGQLHGTMSWRAARTSRAFVPAPSSA